MISHSWSFMSGSLTWMTKNLKGKKNYWKNEIKSSSSKHAFNVIFTENIRALKHEIVGRFSSINALFNRNWVPVPRMRHQTIFAFILFYFSSLQQIEFTRSDLIIKIGIKKLCKLIKIIFRILLRIHWSWSNLNKIYENKRKGRKF